MIVSYWAWKYQLLTNWALRFKNDISQSFTKDIMLKKQNMLKLYNFFIINKSLKRDNNIQTTLYSKIFMIYYIKKTEFKFKFDASQYYLFLAHFQTSFRCLLNTKYRLKDIHFTLYTLHFTLYTLHFTLYT